MTEMTRSKVEGWFIGAVTGYEFAALVAHSDRLPTITTLVGRLPRRYRTVVSLMSAIWLAYHFETGHHAQRDNSHRPGMT